MNQIIATVQNTEGLFFAKDTTGNITQLRNGDTITQGMLVYGDNSNALTEKLSLSMSHDNSLVEIASNDEQSFDEFTFTDGTDYVEEALDEDSINAALLDGIYSEEILEVTEEEDAIVEETEAGEEREKGQSEDAKFDARDGNAVDINSDLREAGFVNANNQTDIQRPDTPFRPAEISINDVIIDEVNGTMTFTVTANAISASDITFSFSSANGTAKDGTDFTAISGTGVILAGQTTATIVVNIIDDFYAEDTETFFINLSNVSSNAIITKEQGVGTILDNGTPDGTGPSEINNPNSPDTSNGYDAEDTVYVKLTTDATANEGDDLVHNIKLVDANGNDVLLYDGQSVTATLTYRPSTTDGASSNDYTAQTTVTITGTTAGNGSATITNPTIDDIFTENDEQYTLTIDSITDNTNTFENILNEGSSVTGTIIDDGGTTPQETTQVLLIALDENGDAILDASGNYTFANDVTEGSSANYMALAFSATESTFNSTTQLDTQLGSVVVSTNDTGSASSNVDYTAQTQTVALGTAFSITTKDDFLADNGETYNVKVDSYVAPTTGATYENVTTNNQEITTTITDNSKNTPNNPYDENTTPPVETDLDTITIKLFALDASGNRVSANEVAEGSSAEYIAVAFDKAGNEVLTNETVEVTFGKIGDSATAGTSTTGDYTATTQTVTLGTKFSTATTDDYIADNNENFSVQIKDESLSNAAKYETVKIDTNSVTTTIIDDSKPNTPNDPTDGIEVDMESVTVKLVSTDINGNIISAATIEEGETAYYKAILVNPDGDEIVGAAGNVDITFTDSTAIRTGTQAEGKNDFSANDATVALNTVFSATANDDFIADSGETFNVQITDDTYTNASAYENVIHNTAPIITTIIDGTTPSAEDTVYIQLINDSTAAEGSNLTHRVQLVDKDGNVVVVKAGETITVTIKYEPNNTTDGAESEDYTATTSVDIVGGTFFTDFTNKALNDYFDENTEQYTATVDTVSQANGVYENVMPSTIANGAKTDDNSVTGTITNVTQTLTPDNAYVDESASSFSTQRHDSDNDTPLDDTDDTVSNNLTKLNLTSELPNSAYKFVFENTLAVTNDNGSNQDLYSNGSLITTSVSADGSTITGTDAVGNKIFDIVLSNGTNDNGSDDGYVYTQYKNIDHPTTNGTDAQKDDTLTMEFGFKIKATNGTDESSVQNFTVTVDDSIPLAGTQEVSVNEDGTLVYAISQEGFKDGNIEISYNNGTSYINLSAHGSIVVRDPNDSTVTIGKLTNNGDGTVTFEPNDNYSNYNAKPNFMYKVTDDDGDYAEGTVIINVKPVADAPRVNVNNVTTTEDNGNAAEGTHSVALGLKVPSLSKDQTDVNANNTGDNSERLGYIELKFNNGASVKGAVLELGSTVEQTGNTAGQDLATITSNNQTIKVVIVDASGNLDTDYHYTGLATSGTNVIALTANEYEALQIIHAEDNDRNITINIKTTSYEVNDAGEPLGTSADLTESKSANMTVKINPVTDDISLTWDDATGGVISQTTIANDTFTFDTKNEGEYFNTPIDLKAILTATSGAGTDTNPDIDGSEKHSYTVSGIPEGTVITLGGQTATAGSNGEATIDFNNVNNKNIDPAFSMKLPEYYGGMVNGKITLSVQDKGVDNGDTAGAVQTKEVYFNIAVKPVADLATLQVSQAVGFEDAGRENGNTSNASNTGDITDASKGIPLNIKVSSDDKDSSESFNIEISAIPDGAVIYYDGNVVTQSPAGTTTITGFENTKALTFIPPHNSDTDYVLKVKAQTVDTVNIDGIDVTDTSAWLSTAKDLQVTVKDVADAPINTELNGFNIDGTENTSGGAYNLVLNEATLDSATNSFALSEVYKTPADLNSYDSDSETLSVVISGLADGFGVEGASPIGNGVWTFLADDIANVKITTPKNFSGEVEFDLKYITTEDAGDSKTHDTDTVKIFVAPSAEATIHTATVANEDVLQKVNFAIKYENGDTNETLQEVRINIDDVTAKDFTLYLGSVTLAEALAANTITKVGDDYILSATQAENVYVKNTTEHDNGTYNFKVGYTVRDTENDQNTFNDKVVNDVDYALTINAVTDTPTIEVGTITETTGDVTVSGTTTTINIAGSEFTVPVTTTSPDKDSSETVTKIIISSVPAGVEVDGATKLDSDGLSGNSSNGIWEITSTTQLDNDGALSNIVFKVNKNADFSSRDMTITTYTKDSGSAEVENASTTIHINNAMGGTGGTGVVAPITLENIVYDIQEDTEFSLGSILKVASGNVNTSITFTDIPDGSEVTGYDSTYVANGKTYYVVEVSGNVADMNAQLSAVKITPPANMNTGGDKDGQFTLKAFTTDNVNIVTEVNQDISPITDKMSINVTAEDINEDGTSKVSITLSNPNDGSKTELSPNSLTIKVTEGWDDVDTNGGTKGTLAGSDYTVVDHNNGTYTVTKTDGSAFTHGTVTDLVYTPASNRDGNVSFEVSATNKETGSDLELSSKGNASIAVTPVVDLILGGITVSSGTEDTAITVEGKTLSNAVKFEAPTLTGVDGSEKLENIVLDKVENGFTVWYNNGTTLVMAMNLGTTDNSTNKWLVPSIDGQVPDFYVNAPKNWAGDFEFEASLNVSEENLSTITQTTEVTLKGTITAVADGLTIDPTLTFGDAYKWTDIKLNANMVDLDGSETMTLTLTGDTTALDESARFRLSDGTYILGDNATFAGGTWTLTGIAYDQINNIEMLYHDYSGDIAVSAKTVDTLNNITDESATVDSTFNLNLSAQTNIDLSTETTDMNIVATNANTNIVGGSGADIIAGGTGNDTISGGTGADTINAGAGNDTITTDGSDIIDGGSGTDTIKLESTASIDFSNLSNIEKIDLSANGDHSLNGLSLSDVLNMTDNNNILTIDADEGDTVTLDGGVYDATTNSSGWKDEGTSNGYTTYSSDNGTDSVTLKIEETITPTIS